MQVLQMNASNKIHEDRKAILFVCHTIPDKFTQQENEFSSPLIPDDLFNSWIIVSDKSGRIDIFPDYCLVKICTDSHHLTNKTNIIL